MARWNQFARRAAEQGGRGRHRCTGGRQTPPFDFLFPFEQLTSCESGTERIKKVKVRIARLNRQCKRLLLHVVLITLLLTEDISPWNQVKSTPKLQHSDATGRCVMLRQHILSSSLAVSYALASTRRSRESGGVTQSCDPSGAEEREPSAATPTPSQSQQYPPGCQCLRLCLCQVPMLGACLPFWTLAACFRIVNHKSGFSTPKRPFPLPTWNPLPSSYGHLSFPDYWRFISC